MVTPYYDDGTVTLYLGDCREVIPALGLTADLVLADPPYAETSLPWDRWPDGWVDVAATVSSSMWCFGSMRMFLDRRDDFASWKLSQDVAGEDVGVLWEKHNGTGFAADRFKRVHEHVLHWYRGSWTEAHQATPRVPYAGPDKSSRARPARAAHTGAIGALHYADDGTRLMRSVIKVKSVRGQRRHPDEKPVELLRPLIEYGCPPGGLVLDTFAGSGSALVAARDAGRRAAGIEANEAYIEKAALRLAQAPLEMPW